MPVIASIINYGNVIVVRRSLRSDRRRRTTKHFKHTHHITHKCKHNVRVRRQKTVIAYWHVVLTQREEERETHITSSSSQLQQINHSVIFIHLNNKNLESILFLWCEYYVI
mmetsp:Transcript_4126/g.10191  ORF Transcript_4126/g.10191 Transcript_4126/m.10191 type:complete len:111 (-) Transcript_4126:228-560(-)